MVQVMWLPVLANQNALFQSRYAEIFYDVDSDKAHLKDTELILLRL